MDFELFSVWDDDTCALCTYSFICSVFKIGADRFIDRVIIPYTVFALPMVIFLMTGFFKSLQNEIFEAACIDGCSIYSCFFKIAAPLTKTGFSVAGMMIFVSSWNELLMALVFISDVNKRLYR